MVHSPDGIVSCVREDALHPVNPYDPAWKQKWETQRTKETLMQAFCGDSDHGEGLSRRRRV